MKHWTPESEVAVPLELSDEMRADPWMRWLTHEPVHAEPDFAGVSPRVTGWLTAGLAGAAFWGGVYIIARAVIG